jgi:hypothetical protein
MDTLVHIAVPNWFRCDATGRETAKGRAWNPAGLSPISQEEPRHLHISWPATMQERVLSILLVYTA